MKLGLVLIMRNESHVITRCLDSVKPLIDFVYISDTGSEDDSPTVVRQWLENNNIAGMVEHEPWINFAHNRTVALRNNRRFTSLSYSLMIDADEQLIIPEGFDVLKFKEGLECDYYNILTRNSNLNYFRPQLFRNDLPFEYRGCLHEYLICGVPTQSVKNISDFYNLPTPDGARSRDPEKFRRDIDLLRKALAVETDAFLISRYTFYLAQSYRDVGDQALAEHYYRQRTKLGFWHEEIYVAHLWAGRLAAWRRAYPLALEHFGEALKLCPHRAEAQYEMAQVYRFQERWLEAYQVGSAGYRMTKPKDGLFIENWIYDYGCAMELAISSYWLSRYSESACLTHKILLREDLPLNYREQANKNLNFATAKLTC